jgi:hypothetical protein
MVSMLAVYFIAQVPPFPRTTKDSLSLVINLFGWNWLSTLPSGIIGEFQFGESPPPGLNLAPYVFFTHQRFIFFDFFLRKA